MVNNQTYSLQAKTRTITGKAVSSLREAGQVPAVVYGHGRENENISIDRLALEKVYAQAGRGSLIQLSIDEKPGFAVVVHELKTNRLTDVFDHVDFYAVKMDEEISSTAMLVFVGEAPAVKAMGGTFVKNKDHLNIKCLPGNLVKELTVDISVLDSFEKSIQVKDVVLPEGVKVTDQEGDIVALVEQPRSEAEIAALNEAVSEDVSKVEGVVKENPAADAVAGDVKAKDKAKS